MAVLVLPSASNFRISRSRDVKFRTRKNERIVDVFLAEKIVLYPLGKPSIPESATNPASRSTAADIFAVLAKLGVTTSWVKCPLFGTRRTRMRPFC